MDRTLSDRDRHSILSRVAKPGRYAGGEYGSVVKEGSGLLRVAVSYPDLYEIGMSNLAVRILYRLLNSLDDVCCERVFAPAPDLEAELRVRGLPLFSLETGRPLRAFDILGFSVGYELTLTNLLAVLDTGGIALRGSGRGAGEPIVIAGGPAVTNPVPFGPFVDAVFIGEAEQWAADTFPRLAGLKRRGAARADLLEALRGHPAVWYPGKTSATRRAVWTGFGEAARPAALAGRPAATFPVAGIRAVQDQGFVEIMRGCPNGCRFCHAGAFYRPFRLREPRVILEEVDELVRGGGYREITLSSLSSADYPGLARLVDYLNRRYREEKVSFSLPSLRINSMTMDLLAGLAKVRKSGLTFAVETPLPEWQRGLNKEAPLERTVTLLREARERGWRQAKFYFMIGLPVSGGADESGPIVDFLQQVQRDTRMNLNVNVAGFIPKPHTPFQWAAQLSEEEALGRIMRVKRGLARLPVKVGYHAPFLSILEGIFSRGDERAGELAFSAFRRGARLDAWEEHADWELWRGLFREAGWAVEAETCRERDPGERLPWDGIELGATRRFLRTELERARRGELTAPCCSGCDAPCGACGREARVKDRVGGLADAGAGEAATLPAPPPEAESRRILFSFAKEGKAVYLSHLNVMTVMERALLRAGYRARFTAGYNPKPRLEFAHALPLGVESQGEVAAIELGGFDSPQRFLERMNRSLPEGIRILRAREIEAPRPGEKKQSLMALFWGADYRVQADGETGEPALKELWRRLERLQAASPPDAGQGSRVRLIPSRGSIRFRLHQSGMEGVGILRFLKETVGIDPLAAGLRVTRAATLARGQDGEPVGYFERL